MAPCTSPSSCRLSTYLLHKRHSFSSSLSSFWETGSFFRCWRWMSDEHSLAVASLYLVCVSGLHPLISAILSITLFLQRPVGTWVLSIYSVVRDVNDTSVFMYCSMLLGMVWLSVPETGLVLQRRYHLIYCCVPTISIWSTRLFMMEVPISIHGSLWETSCSYMLRILSATWSSNFFLSGTRTKNCW